MEKIEWEQYEHGPLAGGYTHYAALEGGAAAFRKQNGEVWIYRPNK